MNILKWAAAFELAMLSSQHVSLSNSLEKHGLSVICECVYYIDDM